MVSPDNGLVKPWFPRNLPAVGIPTASNTTQAATVWIIRCRPNSWRYPPGACLLSNWAPDVADLS